MSGAAALTSHKTVMVVEDDRSTSDLLREIVEDQGLRCVPASEGLTALAMAIEEHPSLITLDFDLPDTDGHRVLHRLLADERTRDIPIVLVTGYRRYLPDTDCHRVAAVLEKPIDVDALADLLTTLLDS
jgi:CheY-like chemotaxis protein